MRRSTSLFLVLLFLSLCTTGFAAEKNLVIGYHGDINDEFFCGVKAEAVLKGVEIRYVEDTENMDCSLLILDHPDFIPENGKCLVYTEKSSQLSEAAGGIFYKKNEEVQFALDTLALFDGHEAPVRAIGLFTDVNSRGAVLYRQMEKKGKLQNKGIYFGSVEEAYDWTLSSLDAITIGVLDSIYCETPDLAYEAYQALKDSDRNDAVEIICQGISVSLMDDMLEDPWLIGAMNGANTYAAGQLMLRMAVSYLQTGKGVWVEQSPVAIFSEALTDPEHDDFYLMLGQQESGMPEIVFEEVVTETAEKSIFDLFAQSLQNLVKEEVVEDA